MNNFMKTNTYLISFILCTHNRAAILKEALDSLKIMRIPDDSEIELIIVDNASSDDTATVIDSFKTTTDGLAIKHLQEKRLGKSFALNKGINEAKGALLAFIDDDHIVSDSYLMSVTRAMNEYDGYHIYCGRILPNWDGSEPQWVHDNDKYPIRPFPIPRFDLGDTPLEVNEDEHFIPGSGNLAVKKEVFDRIGTFSEELGPKGHDLKGGEDIEFVRRALRSGEKVLYIPHMYQHHQVLPGSLKLPYLLRKAYLRSIAAYQHSGDSLNNSRNAVPLYLVRQAITRLFSAALSLNTDARRYYLVRCASTMGEIIGRRKALMNTIQYRTG